MRLFVILATIVACVYLCEGRKHHKKDLSELKIKRPSANPYHVGSKHHRGGKLRGQHLLDKKHDVKSVHDGWMKVPKDAVCKTKKCGLKEFCIKNPKTAEEKCIRRRDFKEGRRLFKSFHNRKELLKGDMKGDAKVSQMEHDIKSAEHMKEVYELVHDYKKSLKLHHHSKDKKDSKKHSSDHKINLAADKKDEVKSIWDMKADIMLKEAETHSVQECRPKELYELRRRLTGWFVMLHTESRQKHHRLEKKLHKKNKKSMKEHLEHKKALAKLHHDKGNTIETETHGKCKCSKSIMWEFTRQDKNIDHHLSHDEMTNMESNRREPCMKPLFKTCDANHDGKLTKGEWCCCLANTIAPCAEKKRTTDAKDWVPRCDKEGYYERQQCHEKTNYCWCVDINGNEIHGTKRLGKAHCGKYDPNGTLIKE